jgi:hypothetical protein
MIDYLSNLVARQLGKIETVHPRLASRFEPQTVIRPPGERMSLGGAEAPDASETGAEFGLETLELIEPVLDAPPRPLSSPRRTTVPALTERDDLTPTLPESPTHNLDKPVRASVVIEQPWAETKTVVEPVNMQTVSQAPAENLSPPERIPETARLLSTAQQPPAPAPMSNSDKVLDAPLPARSERESEPQGGQDDSLMQMQAAPRIVSEQNVLPPPRRRRDVGRVSPAVEPSEGEQSVPPPMSPPPAGRSRHADSIPQSSDAMTPLRVNPVETPVARPAHSPEPAANVIAQPRVARSMEAKVSAEAALNEAVEAAPVINITIGRVEVRATHAPAAPRQQSNSTPPMSLDDYLRRRAGGGSR